MRTSCATPGSRGDSPYLARLYETWNEHLLSAVQALPELQPGDITVLPPDHRP